MTSWRESASGSPCAVPVDGLDRLFPTAEEIAEAVAQGGLSFAFLDRREQLWTHGMPSGPNGRFAPFLPYFYGIWNFSKNKPAAKSLLLAATTEPRALLTGLERLRMPPLLVQIMGFMVRYLDVVADEVRRMRIALASRGFTARNPRHWPVVARSAGALFIRSYERGERVHLAMLSRGYDGRMP